MVVNKHLGHNKQEFDSSVLHIQHMAAANTNVYFKCNWTIKSTGAQSNLRHSGMVIYEHWKLQFLHAKILEWGAIMSLWPMLTEVSFDIIGYSHIQVYILWLSTVAIMLEGCIMQLTLPQYLGWAWKNLILNWLWSLPYCEGVPLSASLMTSGLYRAI